MPFATPALAVVPFPQHRARRRAGQRVRAWSIGAVTALAGLVAQSAMAACPPPPSGLSAVTIATINRTDYEDHVTQILNREILNYLYDIAGHAKVTDNSQGGAVTEWNVDRFGVSDSDFASARAAVKAELEGKVYSIPGDTASLYKSDYKSGERFDRDDDRTTTEDDEIGTESQPPVTTIVVTCTGSDVLAEVGEDYVTGDSENPSYWVALNDVTATVTITTVIVKFIDRITTEWGNDVTEWVVNVSRVIAPALFKDRFEE